ncbi:MAG: nicotinamide riboside transporter PnuC [Prolixibacteraceae bacterium]|jgi:nicotinamide mononucleotide transporter|nr:nicotinamide riboside transporter PnuC [Prolixibacteraceae bacterium]
MNSIVIDWFILNWVEILGTLLGIGYVLLSVKQNILTWALGLATSLLYIYVFYVSKFYADMALQFYYVWISIYGWIIWTKGKQTSHGREKLQVTNVSQKLVVHLAAISILLWLAIYIVLINFTDSPVPLGDAFTTAFSIVATWMLARKIIEHWLIWIVVDIVSIGLYIYKGLYPTTVLFVVYTSVAVWGYIEWRKDMLNETTN